jgi:hypothetical protein
MGHSDNQVIWFTDTRPARRGQPDAGGTGGDGPVAGQPACQPAQVDRAQQAGRAVDSCFDTQASASTAARRVERHPRPQAPQGAASTSSSIFFASPNSMRLLSL